MANIIGTNGNDTLGGSEIYGDTLTGGGGKDFYYASDRDTYTITDFGGIGKDVNPSAAVIAEVDTLIFSHIYDGFTVLSAQNLLLTQNGKNLEITFDAPDSPKIILQNFALENLENVSKSTGATLDLSNILFYKQTSITDSFDVFNANSTQSTISNKNTVTFLNDLNNNVNGFDNSDDVINGQGGNDKIDGKSGNDMLRGGAGNNTLIGGAGNDILNVESSTGDNILNGGTDNDILNAGASSGNNLLSGGDGNDSLYAAYVDGGEAYEFIPSSGDNTLYGGAGDDSLSAFFATGNNLLDGGDGNDYLSISSSFYSQGYYIVSGNNTLNGGAGNDILDAAYVTGDNLLSGGDGNDSFYVASLSFDSPDSFSFGLVTQTVDGGTGDDFLSVDYSNATRGITTTFNATTNIGSIITAGTNQVSYKNIERLNILGTGFDDNIVGSNGNDTLFGGYGGNDTLTGGNGNDTFAFSSYNQGVARVDDFNATNELIQVSAADFGGRLLIGSLQKSQFTIGASATTSNQRFIYDFTTGGLYFDSDGSAAAFTQVKFAQLSAGLSLTNNNFVVV